MGGKNGRLEIAKEAVGDASDHTRPLSLTP